MLISMPHGTSTIFGAFQAILALLETGRTCALTVKLPCDEKFASEIFFHETHTRLLQRNSCGRVGILKLKQINGFFARSLCSAASHRCRRMETSNKELVSVPRLPFRPLRPH
jgi:hypothetical protein